MAGAQDKAVWVQRVLGLSVAVPAEPGRARQSFVAIWRQAKEQVDGGIGALQDRMRAHPLKALGRIADRGLNGVTDKAGVGMMAAMIEADQRAGAAAGKAVAAIKAMRDFLATDVAAAIDENPFEVPVNLRATFRAALDSIETQIAA